MGGGLFKINLSLNIDSNSAVDLMTYLLNAENQNCLRYLEEYGDIVSSILQGRRQGIHGTYVTLSLWHCYKNDLIAISEFAHKTKEYKL